MSKRGFRFVALAASGGLLLQLGGCASLLVDQVIGTIVGNIIAALIQSIIGSAGATA